MNKTPYKKTLPADAYLSVSEPKELPEGDEFMTVFTRFVRKHGNRTIQHYADLMALDPEFMLATIRALSGIKANDWVNEYVRMEACELLEVSNWSVSRIAKHLGFSSLSTFCQFFLRMQKTQASEYRIFKTTGEHSGQYFPVKKKQK